MTEKAMNIIYRVHNNLYLNLTNRCSSACTFCLRQNRNSMEASGSLWLIHEPSIGEVIDAFKQFCVDDFDEIVFCGFGEPTMSFEVLKETAQYIRNNWNKPIRLNTNGQGNLINKRDITPELEGLIDTVSISLNYPGTKRYQEIVNSQFGEKAYSAMLEFAKSVSHYVPHVILSTVDTILTKEEEQLCAELCHSLGVTYRIREWDG